MLSLSHLTGWKVWGGISLLLMLAIVMLTFSPHQVPTTPINTVTVVRGDLESIVLATGVVMPSQQVLVGAQVNGQLRKLHVKEGDRVRRGELLAEIDPTIQNNDLRKAEAELKSALAQRSIAKIALTKDKLAWQREELMGRDNSGIVSNLESARAQYQIRQQELAISEARVVQSEIALETARANLSYTRIASPIDGEVLLIAIKEGQTLVSSQEAPTIMIVANIDTMTVNAPISEVDVSRVHAGQQVRFHVLSNRNRTFLSSLSSIKEATPDLLEELGGNKTKSEPSPAYYQATVMIENNKRQIRPLMTAQVSIIVAQAKNALLIPSSVLEKPLADDRYRIMVMDAGRCVVRDVRVGINDGQFAEVLEGVIEGERVVVAPASGEYACP